MRRTLSKFFFTVSAILGITVVHLGLRYFFQFPFDMLNATFALLTLLLVIRETGSVVWLSFFAHLLIELYTVTPFGITLFAGTISTLLMYWLFRQVFTNRSWYTALALSSFGILAYRLLYSLLLFAFGDTAGASGNWVRLAQLYGWELVTTASVSAALFLLIRPFVRQLRADTIFA